MNFTYSEIFIADYWYDREKIWDDLEKCEKKIIKIVDSEKIRLLVDELSDLTRNLNKGLTNLRVALKKIRAIKR